MICRAAAQVTPRVVAFWITLFVWLPVCVARDVPQPNVVLILVDDLGYGELDRARPDSKAH